MINVIYEKSTGRVMVYEENGIICMPSTWGLLTFGEGNFPVMFNNKNGEMFVKPNSFVTILHNDRDEGDNDGQWY